MPVVVQALNREQNGHSTCPHEVNSQGNTHGFFNMTAVLEESVV